MALLKVLQLKTIPLLSYESSAQGIKQILNRRVKSQCAFRSSAGTASTSTPAIPIVMPIKLLSRVLDSSLWRRVANNKQIKWLFNMRFIPTTTLFARSAGLGYNEQFQSSPAVAAGGGGLEGWIFTLNTVEIFSSQL